jgi:hypothetical protein
MRSALFIAALVLRRTVQNGAVHSTGPAHSFDNSSRSSSQRRLRLDPVDPTVVAQIFGRHTEPRSPPAPD